MGMALGRVEAEEQPLPHARSVARPLVPRRGRRMGGRVEDGPAPGRARRVLLHVILPVYSMGSAGARRVGGEGGRGPRKRYGRAAASATAISPAAKCTKRPTDHPRTRG